MEPITTQEQSNSGGGVAVIEAPGALCSAPGSESVAALKLPPPKPLLTADEKRELASCKEVIDEHLEGFVAVALALGTVRDKRLYRETHETFDAWCQAEYGWSARRARQLCAAAETVRNLQEVVGERNNCSAFLVPATESQARPLVGLPPEEQRAAWQEAVAMAPNGRITAKVVEQVVRARRVRLGLEPEIQEPIAKAEQERPDLAPGVQMPAEPGPQLGPVVDVVQVKGREHERRLAADRVIGELRSLMDLAGTADSQEAVGLRVALQQVQYFRDHQVRLERLQLSRARQARLGEKGKV